MHLSQIIRSARTAKGMTQSQTAQAAGVSLDAVSDAENGRGRLSTAVAILDALGAHISGMPKGSSIAERLSRARLQRGLSQEQVARRSGLSRPTVALLERGQGLISSFDAVAAVLAPQLRLRREERREWTPGDRDCRFTPPEVFEPLSRAVGGFDLDPCGHQESPITVGHRYLQSDDGLSQRWFGRVYMNPPFSGSATWITKARQAVDAGECELVVGLLPTRTHTRSFHDHVAGVADVILLAGRVSFISPQGRKDRAPFGCMVVVWGRDDTLVYRIAEDLPGMIIRRR